MRGFSSRSEVVIGIGSEVDLYRQIEGEKTSSSSLVEFDS